MCTSLGPTSETDRRNHPIPGALDEPAGASTPRDHPASFRGGGGLPWRGLSGDGLGRGFLRRLFRRLLGRLLLRTGTVRGGGAGAGLSRSEERRGGKEGRSWGAPLHYKQE